MKDLPFRAKTYILLVMLIAAIISLNIPDFRAGNAWLFLAVIVFTSFTQLNQTAGLVPDSTYNASVFGYSMAFFALGVEQAVWVAIISHSALLLHKKEDRIPWYVLAFNIGGVVIPLYLAGLAFDKFFTAGTNNLFLISGMIVSGALFIGLNHLMFGLIHIFAEGTKLKESGMFGYILVLIDITLFGLGSASALLWNQNPYAVILTIAPLYLFQMTLQVPRLEKQKNIEPKTGLFNSQYFNQELDRELKRANRYDRPLAVVMADLDYLRSINNNYGHLAGDVILVGIAKMIKESVRDYDIVARFGGEEFTILMPETTPEQALPRIESLRKAIATTDFVVPTHTSPLNITMSFGISGRSNNNRESSKILHSADVAVYQAKQNGRNCVVLSST